MEHIDIINDYTDMSMLREMSILDRKIDNLTIKSKNESELEFEINDDFLEFESKNKMFENEVSDYEKFQENINNQNLQDLIRKEQNLKNTQIRKKIYLEKNENKEEIEKETKMKDHKCKEDFIPWILIVVATVVSISIIKRAFTD